MMRKHTSLALFIIIAAILAGCAAGEATPTQSPPPTDEIPTATEASPTESADPMTEAPDETLRGLRDFPVIPAISERARQIYATGQSIGRDPHVFAKVGDCMTADESFLFPYSSSRDGYALGDYGYLQETVGQFSGVTIREHEGQPVDAFANPSLAVSCGFNSASPQDALWADPAWCEAGESPLECEYRIANPSIALILLGTHDVYFEQEQFRGYLESIVETTIDAGIVPVLATFPPRSDDLAKSEAYNVIIADVASAYEVPLANVWLAFQDLPDLGLDPESDTPTDLSLPADGCGACFSEANLQTGMTMRNLVVLQALDAVWKGVQE